MTQRIRTTISLSPEALEIFKRMAEAGNMSVSRCMGDWLTDTADAAEMITLKMEEAKKAPMKVMREMRALVSGMAVSVDEASEEVRRIRQRDSQRAQPSAAEGASPPSSNTGGKSPTSARKGSK